MLKGVLDKMTDLEIISKNPVALAEMKAKLEATTKGKKDEDLSARVVRVKEYLNDFAEFDVKEVEELKKKFEGLGIQRLKDRIIIKMIDIQPSTIEELKTIFTGENVTLKQEDMTKILEVIENT